MEKLVHLFNSYHNPIAARYSPHLSTISESPFVKLRRYTPGASTTTTAAFARPRRVIDTADIDVSKPPRSLALENRQQRHRLRRDRPTIKIRSQALKDNPALREYNEKHEKTVGEMLVEKFLIKDKQENEGIIKYHREPILLTNNVRLSKEHENDILASIRRRVTRRMTRRRSSADVVPLDQQQIEREAAFHAAQAEALDTLVAEEQAEIEMEVRRGTFAKRQAMRMPSEISEVSGSDDDEMDQEDADDTSKKHFTVKRKRRKKELDKPAPVESDIEEDDDEIIESVIGDECEWDDRENFDDIKEQYITTVNDRMKMDNGEVIELVEDLSNTDKKINKMAKASELKPTNALTKNAMNKLDKDIKGSKNLNKDLVTSKLISKRNLDSVEVKNNELKVEKNKLEKVAERDVEKDDTTERESKDEDAKTAITKFDGKGKSISTRSIKDEDISKRSGDVKQKNDSRVDEKSAIAAEEKEDKVSIKKVTSEIKEEDKKLRIEANGEIQKANAKITPKKDKKLIKATDKNEMMRTRQEEKGKEKVLRDKSTSDKKQEDGMSRIDSNEKNQKTKVKDIQKEEQVIKTVDKNKETQIVEEGKIVSGLENEKEISEIKKDKELVKTLNENEGIKVVEAEKPAVATTKKEKKVISKKEEVSEKRDDSTKSKQQDIIDESEKSKIKTKKAVGTAEKQKRLKRTISAPQREVSKTPETIAGFKVEACNSVGDLSTLFVKAANNSTSDVAKTVEQFRESIRLPSPRRVTTSINE